MLGKHLHLPPSALGAMVLANTTSRPFFTTQWLIDMPVYSLRNVLRAQDAGQLAADTAKTFDVRVREHRDCERCYVKNCRLVHPTLHCTTTALYQR